MSATKNQMYFGDTHMKTKIMILTMFLLIAMGFLACGKEDTNNSASRDQVTVQLKWVNQAQFAGFYVAQEKGYYADENLEVTLIPGGIGIDSFAAVVDGGVTFGVAGADSIIVQRAAGLPIKAIAVTYRVNPFVLVAFADSGIKSPRDFVGRTVSVSENYGDMAQLNTMLRNVGVDPALVTVVPYTYDNTAFLAGEVDVLNSFVAGSLLVLEEGLDGRDITLIWPGDYGVHFYSDTLFATDDTITNDPDLVTRFLRATLKGHRFAVENPEAAVDASMIYAENQDRDVQAEMFFASIPLFHTGENHIGWMLHEVWQGMHDTLLEQGILEEPVDLDTVYTMQFLESIYGRAP
jgi:NitT/TauT family transport system substrate-binding protein